METVEVRGYQTSCPFIPVLAIEGFDLNAMNWEDGTFMTVRRVGSKLLFYKGKHQEDPDQLCDEI
ncbi:MAG: hypothetical protein HUJ72_02360 [Blautia sp.]|nr:hypothetical protein [Blautia sp.]